MDYKNTSLPRFIHDRFIVDNTEIAQSMNKFFCSVGEKLSDEISQQPNPLLSNEYVVNQSSTQFRFKAVSPLVQRGA